MVTNLVVLGITLGLAFVIGRNFIGGVRLLTSESYAKEVAQKDMPNMISRFLGNDEAAYRKFLRTTLGPFWLIGAPLAVIAVLAIAFQPWEWDCSLLGLRSGAFR